MPILFKTSNKNSAVHGLGVFAEEDIPKGSVWWVADSSVPSVPCLNAPNLPNELYHKDNFHKFTQAYNPQQMPDIIEHTMYYDEGGLLIHLKDGTGVLNHGFDFNSQMIANRENKYQKLYSIATRDIKAGEEITENYGNYIKVTHNWAEEVFKKYAPSRLQFEKDFGIKKITVYE